MTTRPTHVGTIGDKIRIGHSLTINCGNRECLHRAKLDLEDIAARFGANLPVADLVARAVCAECGARWPELSISVSVARSIGQADEMNWPDSCRIRGASALPTPSFTAPIVIGGATGTSVSARKVNSTRPRAIFIRPLATLRTP